MAYPSITSITPSTFATNTTAHAVAMAATHATGELIVAVITNDGGATVTTPSGWTQLYTLAGGTSVSGHAYAKVSDGTEGGTTVDFVTSASETMAAQVYRITDWHGVIAGIEAGTAATSTIGSLADNPSLTASWGSADNLWLATCHTSTSQTASSAPTSFTDLTQTASGATTADAQAITARRNNTTATENPDGFTMSSTGAVKVFNTLVIRPLQALTPSLFTNAATFFVAVVTAGAVSVTPDLYANTNTFYTPVVSAGSVALTPALFSNTNTFYSASVTPGEVGLTPDLFSNTNTFYSPTATPGAVDLTPSLFANTNTFYPHTVALGSVVLTPNLFVNTNTFYSPTSAAGAVDLTPELFANSNIFYSPVVSSATVTAESSYFATGGQWIYDYAEPIPKTKQERRKLTKKKQVIDDLILEQIKNDKFVLRGVEKAIIRKGYKNDSETNILLYNLLHSSKYESIRVDIDKALILLKQKINRELQKQQQQDEEDLIQIVALLLH